jgi:hypothetical protein
MKTITLTNHKAAQHACPACQSVECGNYPMLVEHDGETKTTNAFVANRYQCHDCGCLWDTGDPQLCMLFGRPVRTDLYFEPSDCDSGLLERAKQSERVEVLTPSEDGWHLLPDDDLALLLDGEEVTS